MQVESPHNSCQLKLVDSTTASEFVCKGHQSSAQATANKVAEGLMENNVKLKGGRMCHSFTLFLYALFSCTQLLLSLWSALIPSWSRTALPGA